MYEDEIKQKPPVKKQLRSEGAGINIGSSSLLMIFVVLCLVSFAALSIVSSNADRNLSAKVLEHSSAYYDACNQAESKIANIDDSLFDAYQKATSKEEYYDIVGKNINFAIPVTEVHTLNVEIEVLYPDTIEGDLFQILSYNLTPTGNLELDESLPLPVF